MEIEFSPDGTLVAIATEPGPITLARIEPGGDLRHLKTLGRHRSGATVLAFAPDGRALVSADSQQQIIAWTELDAEVPSWRTMFASDAIMRDELLARAGLPVSPFSRATVPEHLGSAIPRTGTCICRPGERRRGGLCSEPAPAMALGSGWSATPCEGSEKYCDSSTNAG